MFVLFVALHQWRKKKNVFVSLCCRYISGLTTFVWKRSQDRHLWILSFVLRCVQIKIWKKGMIQCSERSLTTVISTELSCAVCWQFWHQSISWELGMLFPSYFLFVLWFIVFLIIPWIYIQGQFEPKQNLSAFVFNFTFFLTGFCLKFVSR